MIRSSFWQDSQFFCLLNSHCSVINWKHNPAEKNTLKIPFLRDLCKFVSSFFFFKLCFYLTFKFPDFHWLFFIVTAIRVCYFSFVLSPPPEFPSFPPVKIVYYVLALCQTLGRISGTAWGSGCESHEFCFQLAHNLLKMILEILFDNGKHIVLWRKFALFPWGVLEV
jgi:hypothetical protein